MFLPTPAGLEVPSGQRDALRVAWSTPGRVYHGWAHLLAVLAEWADVQRDGAWEDPTQTWLAVLYHDAVYVPGRPDNEARSAAMCLDEARLWLGLDATPAAALIGLTAQHGRLDAAALTPDARLFLDADMAILGAEPAAYARYEAEVAAEYAPVYGAAWAAGRRAFLDTVLASERIFMSERYFVRLEARARANLRAARARLV